MKKVENIQIESFNDLIEYFTTSNSCGHYVYRGTKNTNFKLIPSVGRLEYCADWSKESRLANEKELIKKFKLKSIGQLKTLPQSEIEWMVLTQHFGIPTRLLDWTRSPLVALFFAIPLLFVV